MEVLETDYLPSSLTARDTQQQELYHCLEPALLGMKPNHAWLYGPCGVGKSSVATSVTREIAARSSARIVRVNCGENRTFYTVIDQIVGALRLVKSIERGVSFKLAVLRKFAEKEPLIVVLDEIHLMQPQGRMSTLHALASLSKLGLICISMDRQPLLQLDEATYSRLVPTLIEFWPYTPAEVRGILDERLQQVGAVEATEAELCQEIAALSRGDARVALQLLRNALIPNAGQSSRGWKHQLASVKDFKRDQQMQQLHVHEQLVYHVLRMHQRMLTTDILREYGKVCREKKLPPMSRRSVANYLKSLVSRGWASELPSGKQSGAHLYRIVD